MTSPATLPSPRPALPLDGFWEFHFAEGASIEQVADPAFRATDTMVVPGCWDVLPKWYLKRGTGLYRRTFTLDRPVDNAWLVVDGMGLRAEFRLDGRPLGVHPYPYLRLEIETGPLDGGEHVLFAALDNRFDWATMKLARPYYDFYFYGGFYHGVSLAFDNRRLRVRTRDWSTRTVEIEAENFAERDFDATLLFDGSHEVAASFRDGRATVSLPGFALWSPDSPNLHTVSLVNADAIVATARFGIRQVEARERRIWLNGETVFLKGLNRHESHAEFGAATPEAVMIKDLQNLKALGGNFIRGAHYPQSQRFLDLCDEMGVLVWEESLGWGNGQDYTDKEGTELDDADFVEQQVAQTRAMVRASFNHPCVVLFGFLNEVASQKPAVKALVDRLVAAIRAEDSGRLVTFACNVYKDDLCHADTDVVSFNAYPGTIPCFPGLPDQLAEKVRNASRDGLNTLAALFRARYPDKPILLSESGCAGQYGLRDPAAGWGSEDFQDEYIADILGTVLANPEFAGCCLWQMNDNRTYHRNSTEQPGKPWGGFSYAGLFDVQRRPKMSVATVRRFYSMPAPRRS